MNSKFSKILTITVAVLSLIGIALFINVSVTDDIPEKISSAVGPLISFSIILFYAAVLITVAFLVEKNQGVGGSNPSLPTNRGSRVRIPSSTQRGNSNNRFKLK